VSDEALIKDKISEYARAFSSLDADAVRRVYPGITTGLAQTFANFRSLNMTIVLGPIVVSGSEATVTCQVQQSIQPKVGSRQSPPSQQTTFRLRKTNGQWIITDRKP
jgi:ketosteroid isomerase-like protein